MGKFVEEYTIIWRQREIYVRFTFKVKDMKL